ncbi:hypothetical protein EAPG_01509 [Escherichia albertii B156]|nr:hypothetical protein EAPG_01509 [Escherichia albertii B156]
MQNYFSCIQLKYILFGFIFYGDDLSYL